jgi:predicted transcriptional regulator
LPQYTAKKVANSLGLTKSTVHHHIKKLERFNLIKCINGKDKVKFYEKTVDPHIVPVKDRGAYLVSSMDLGRGPDAAILQPDMRHKKKATICNNGKIETTARIHAIAYKISINEKFKNKYEDIIWEKKSRPNNRFDQFTKKVQVPAVGDVSFKWVHTTKVDTLTAYLPTIYILPHEIDQVEKVIDEYVWKAYRFFIRTEHVGLERIPEQVGKYHIAYPASVKQKEYIKKRGTLSVKTEKGKIEIDDSMDDGGEVETDNIEDAKLYNEVREDLCKPQIIRTMDERLQETDAKTDKQKEKIETITDRFVDFQKYFSEYMEHEKKRWEEQQEFNQQVVRYMERTDGHIVRIMREIGLERFPTKQKTLNEILENEKKDRGMMYG